MSNRVNKPKSKEYGMICLRPRGKDWPKRLKTVAEKRNSNVSEILNDLIDVSLPRLEAEVGISPLTHQSEKQP